MFRLPFNLKPPACCYQFDAFPCGIIFSKNEKYLPYVLSYFIQLLYDFGYNKTLIFDNQNWMFRNHELIGVPYWLVIPRFLAEKNNFDFSAIVREALYGGYYIYGYYSNSVQSGDR